MIHSAEKLNDVIAANDPKSIAMKLYSVELLTPDVYQEVAFLNITATDRANKIVNALTLKVKSQPSLFEKMIAIFTQNGLNHLVAFLQEKLRKF